jgi:hypothetical protein
MTILERFMSKVNKTENGCWLWTAGCNRDGYGGFGYNGRSRLAHRVSWMLHRGDIPEGVCVLHNCPERDDERCVNPDHLFLGNRSDNMQDAIRKGQTAVGEKNARSKLTEDQVTEIRGAYVKGVTSFTSLGEKYRVDRREISRIIGRFNWKHVK